MSPETPWVHGSRNLTFSQNLPPICSTAQKQPEAATIPSKNQPLVSKRDGRLPNVLADSFVPKQETVVQDSRFRHCRPHCGHQTGPSYGQGLTHEVGFWRASTVA